jgi:PHD/YefM family antitoxin component YafN of YafNO toxin-antitoxin module
MGLGIREARNTLPSLIKRAAEEDEEIQLGARGADEVTLVATRKYQRMSNELEDLRTEIADLKERLAQMSDRVERAGGTGRPFAGLQRALESGRLSVGTPEPRIREYMPDYRHSSAVSREERVRFGSGTAEPQYHRPGPRA